MVSSYKTADGQTHEMADVWFAKSAAGNPTVPRLDELLAGAPADLAPVSPVPAATQTAAAPQLEPVASPPPHRVGLDEELLRKLAPLV